MSHSENSGTPRCLFLGNGKESVPKNAIKVDKRPEARPDILHDLDCFPWPLESNAFDEVVMRDVIEHLSDIPKVMEELHRVTRAGGIIRITTPHYSSHNSFTDPTHKQHLGFFSFDYFTGENQWDFYTQVRFKKKHAYLFFYPGILSKIIHRLANRFPNFYEKRLAWIFPAWFMSFELIVIKSVKSE